VIIVSCMMVWPQKFTKTPTWRNLEMDTTLLVDETIIKFGKTLDGRLQ